MYDLRRHRHKAVRGRDVLSTRSFVLPEGMHVSESKAEALRRSRELESRLTQAEQDVTFLLKTLMDIHDEHPHIDLPDLGQRFDESHWRAVL